MLTRELGSAVNSDPSDLLRSVSTDSKNLTKYAFERSKMKDETLTRTKTLVRCDKRHFHLPSWGGSRGDPGRFNGSWQIFDGNVPTCNGLVPPAPKFSGCHTDIVGCDAFLDSELGGGIQKTSSLTHPPMLDTSRAQTIKGRHWDVRLRYRADYLRCRCSRMA